MKWDRFSGAFAVGWFGAIVESGSYNRANDAVKYKVDYLICLQHLTMRFVA